MSVKAEYNGFKYEFPDGSTDADINNYIQNHQIQLQNQNSQKDKSYMSQDPYSTIDSMSPEYQNVPVQQNQPGFFSGTEDSSIGKTISSSLDRRFQNTLASLTSGENQSRYQRRKAELANKTYAEEASKLSTLGHLAAGAVDIAPVMAATAITRNPAAGAAMMGGLTTADTLAAQLETQGDYNWGDAAEAGAGAAAFDMATMGVAGKGLNLARQLSTPVRRVSGEVGTMTGQGAVSAGGSNTLMNLASGRPWDQNLGESMAMGGLAGGTIHGGSMGFNRLTGANQGLGIQPNESGTTSIDRQTRLKNDGFNIPEDVSRTAVEYDNLSRHFNEELMETPAYSQEAFNHIEGMINNSLENGSPSAISNAYDTLLNNGMPLTAKGLDIEFGTGYGSEGIHNLAELQGYSRTDIERAGSALHRLVPRRSTLKSGLSPQGQLKSIQDAYNKSINEIMSPIKEGISHLDRIIAENKNLTGGPITSLNAARNSMEKLNKLANNLYRESTIPTKEELRDVSISLMRSLNEAGELGNMKGLDGKPGSFNPVDIISTLNFVHKAASQAYPSVREGKPDVTKESSKTLDMTPIDAVIDASLIAAHLPPVKTIGGMVKKIMSGGHRERQYKRATSRAEESMRKWSEEVAQRSNDSHVVRNEPLERGDLDGGASKAADDLAEMGYSVKESTSPKITDDLPPVEPSTKATESSQEQSSSDKGTTGQEPSKTPEQQLREFIEAMPKADAEKFSKIMDKLSSESTKPSKEDLTFVAEMTNHYGKQPETEFPVEGPTIPESILKERTGTSDPNLASDYMRSQRNRKPKEDSVVSEENKQSVDKTDLIDDGHKTGQLADDVFTAQELIDGVTKTDISEFASKPKRREKKVEEPKEETKESPKSTVDSKDLASKPERKVKEEPKEVEQPKKEESKKEETHVEDVEPKKKSSVDSKDLASKPEQRVKEEPKPKEIEKPQEVKESKPSEPKTKSFELAMKPLNEKISELNQVKVKDSNIKLQTERVKQIDLKKKIEQAVTNYANDFRNNVTKNEVGQIILDMGGVSKLTEGGRTPAQNLKLIMDEHKAKVAEQASKDVENIKKLSDEEIRKIEESKKEEFERTVTDTLRAKGIEDSVISEAFSRARSELEGDIKPSHILDYSKRIMKENSEAAKAEALKTSEALKSKEKDLSNLKSGEMKIITRTLRDSKNDLREYAERLGMGSDKDVRNIIERATRSLSGKGKALTESQERSVINKIHDHIDAQTKAYEEALSKPMTDQPIELARYKSTLSSLKRAQGLKDSAQSNLDKKIDSRKKDAERLAHRYEKRDAEIESLNKEIQDLRKELDKSNEVLKDATDSISKLEMLSKSDIDNVNVDTSKMHDKIINEVKKMLKDIPSSDVMERTNRVVEDMPATLESINDPRFIAYKATLEGVSDALRGSGKTQEAKATNATLKALENALKRKELTDNPELWVSVEDRNMINKKLSEDKPSIAPYYGTLYQKLRAAVFGDESTKHYVHYTEGRINSEIRKLKEKNIDPGEAGINSPNIK